MNVLQIFCGFLSRRVLNEEIAVVGLSLFYGLFRLEFVTYLAWFVLSGFVLEPKKLIKISYI